MAIGEGCGHQALKRGDAGLGLLVEPTGAGQVAQQHRGNDQCLAGHARQGLDQPGQKLDQRQVSDDLKKKIRELYSEFDFVRFASGSVTGEQKTRSLETLKQVLAEFEKKAR